MNDTLETHTLLARPACGLFTVVMQESKKFFITRAYLRGATEQSDHSMFFYKTKPVEINIKCKLSRTSMLKGLNKLKRTDMGSA